MKYNATLAVALVGSFAVLGPLVAIAQSPTATPAPAATDTVALGKSIVINPSLGNCLACHTMAISDVNSTVGPKLANMKATFPNRDVLYSIIYDESAHNPSTVMPAFGKNLILSHDQIEAVIDYLYTL